jgi:hypothetical protein
MHPITKEAAMIDLIARLIRPTPQWPEPGLRPTLPVLTLPAEAAEAAESACGWFESSWELRQGLAVSEWPDSDLTVAALWFGKLAGGTCPVLPSASWPGLQ